jgi:bacteriorhodopsin
MCTAGLAFIGLSYRKERRDRLFHYMTAAVVFVAAIAYCKAKLPFEMRSRRLLSSDFRLVTMGSNLGFTPIRVEYQRNNPVVAGTYRSIYYVRYIDWFITTPLLLLDLLLTAGMPWPTLLWVLMVDWIMVSGRG